MTVATGTTSNPISYKHNDVQHRRKIVKFYNDHRKQQHETMSDGTLGNHRANSILHQHGSYDEEDLEPQSVDVATNASLMSQVATHILGSFGTSWQMDGTSSICGGASTSLFPIFYENDFLRLGHVNRGYQNKWQPHRIILVVVPIPMMSF